MKRLRWPALFLALAILLAVPASAVEAEDWLAPKTRAAPDFSDVAGTWCESYVKTAYEAGLMDGKSADRFDPNGTLTEAQRLVIGVRLHALLHGQTVETPAQGEPWWLPSARYYLAVDGDTETDPEDFRAMADTPADRLSFAFQLAWSVPALPVINEVEETVIFSQLTGEAGEAVLMLYRAGILSGVDDYGRFDPSGTLTRGQAAAMLARLVDPDRRLHFSLHAFDLCRDVYQLDPDTVMLTVDGEPVLLNEFVYPLTVRLTAASSTAVALDAAVSDIAQSRALARLAAEKQPPSSPELRAFFCLTTGLPPSAIVAAARSHFLYEDLLAVYPSQETLDGDLNVLTAAMTVTSAPALDRLDLDAARARLLSSPYCYQ